MSTDKITENQYKPTTLDRLTNTSFSNLQDGDVLKYNSASGVWKNSIFTNNSEAANELPYFFSFEVDHTLQGTDAYGFAEQGTEVTRVSYPMTYDILLALYNSGTSTTHSGISCKQTSDGRYIAAYSSSIKTQWDNLYTSSGKADIYLLNTSAKSYWLPKETSIKKIYYKVGRVGQDYINDPPQSIIDLGNKSGTVSLETNKVYRVTLTGTTTFSLPANPDATIFNQILVQMYQAAARTISLGTSKYFYDEEPDLSEIGRYDIIYEYDGTNWVVGVMYKGN